MTEPDPDVGAHEAALTYLLEKHRRRRWREVLESGNEKGRVRMLDALHHRRPFVATYMQQVPASAPPSWELEELRRRGAPATCVVIGGPSELDGTVQPLEEALDRVVGSLHGTVVSCIPGRLAYFESEDPGERYILDRPAIR